MRLKVWALGASLIATGATAGAAGVSESQFPPRTVADLIAICGPAQDDPLMTAAVNFCHGYPEGAVDVEQRTRRNPAPVSYFACRRPALLVAPN